MPKLTFSPTGIKRAAISRIKRLVIRRAPAPLVHRLRQLQHFAMSRRISTRTTAGLPAVTRGSVLSAPKASPSYPFVMGYILDEFSEASWEPEFETIPIQPGKEVPPIDFLLVEAAWIGNNGVWQYQLAGGNAPSVALRKVVETCQERGIPTVFWNKEDPAHFEDFLETAGLFDHIATTDTEMVEQYKRLYPNANVFVLPFAAQPVFHNPARNNIPQAGRHVAFAGTYFQHKFESRRSQMDFLLGAAHNVSRQTNTSFHIFSRHAGGDFRYQFPAKWREHVIGSLPYPEMLSAYRAYQIFLNVNSITTSPSMCSRRIFELAASGTPVVSTPSAALRNYFSEEEVLAVSSAEEAEMALRGLLNSELLRRRTSHLALRRVWSEHTYRHRGQLLLDQLKIESESMEPPRVSVICSTNRDPKLSKLLEQVAQQTHPVDELCVLGHGLEIDPDFVERAQKLGIRAKVLYRDATATLGSCLNDLIDSASGDIIAKFDDDDFYFPNYLLDQVNALVNMEADLVGKSSIYFYLSRKNVLARRWKDQEHSWRGFVAGATFVGWRSTFIDTPYANRTRGEDTDFLTRLERKGKKVYSADSFNYLCVRGEVEHTWGISDAEILSNSEVETIGLNLEHVEV